MTWRRSTQPWRARSTPQRMKRSSSTECASASIASDAPSSMGTSRRDVVEIEALGLGVDLEHHALARGDAAHLVEIGPSPLPLGDESSRRARQHIHETIL